MGDCDGGGSVTVDELVIMVDIALGRRPVSDCPAGIGSGSAVGIQQIIGAVNAALNGCRVRPPPHHPRPTVTPTPG